MSHLKRMLLVALCLSLLFSVPLTALDTGQGKSKKAKENKERKDDREDLKEVEFALDFLIDFTSEDARHYAEESKLVGQKPLPPGIRKNLARGKPLPPGIAKREMPKSFVSQLPKHEDYEWSIAGTDLVLLSKSDKLVKEIAKDIFK